MTHADIHTPAYDRLMRLADRVLTALETVEPPKTAMDIGRIARAILAAERMLRAIYTPLVKKKKTTSSPAIAGEVAASEAKVTEGAHPNQTPNADWQKGWADKQAQMREQRAARTGKWPDGTAYKKPTKKTG